MDDTPPQLAFTSPIDGELVTGPNIDVSGTVVDASAVIVTVQDIEAVVAGGTFVASGVPVQRGPNVVTAVATDAAGNVASVSVSFVAKYSQEALIDQLEEAVTDSFADYLAGLSDAERAEEAAMARGGGGVLRSRVARGVVQARNHPVTLGLANADPHWHCGRRLSAGNGVRA